MSVSRSLTYETARYIKQSDQYLSFAWSSFKVTVGFTAGAFITPIALNMLNFGADAIILGLVIPLTAASFTAGLTILTTGLGFLHAIIHN